MALTTQTCWDDPAFILYWDATEEATGNNCWDDSPQLDRIIEGFNRGETIQRLATTLKEAAEAAYDAYMSTPPWDR
jgi:hypothetical protein